MLTLFIIVAFNCCGSPTNTSLLIPNIIGKSASTSWHCVASSIIQQLNSIRPLKCQKTS